MLELQLHDIEVRLTVAKLDANLEALRAKRGELADDVLASDAGLVAAAGPDQRVSQRVASGRSSLGRRASLSGSLLGPRPPGSACRTARRGLPAVRATARARRGPPDARRGRVLPAAQINSKENNEIIVRYILALSSQGPNCDFYIHILNTFYIPIQDV